MLENRSLKEHGVMLRCRRCRKGIIDSASLLVDEDTDESPAGMCSLWHVNVEALPEWILSSVHQAQWTAGKLNCRNCSARLGSFNFVHHFSCPCGRDATIHLNKSRVDPEHQRRLLLVQPRAEPSPLLTLGSQMNESERSKAKLRGLTPAVPRSSAAVSPGSAWAGESSRAFSFSPLTCIRKPASVEDVATASLSCCCSAGPADSPSPWLMSAEAGGGARGGRPSLHAACEAPFSSCSLTSTRRLSPPPQHMLEDHVSSVETSEDHGEGLGSFVLPGASPDPDTCPEGDEQVTTQAEALLNSLASNKLSKREKNRLKGLRRKQRKRERWLHSQLEKAEESLQDSEEDGEGQEGLTCAVCLDIYICPYACRPCGHSFCEPCLRTIANNRPMSTTCPLCRTLISHTDFNKELDHKSQTLFPKIYRARKQNFKSASCAKWPLPSSRKSFCTFWRERRQAVRMGGHWRFHHHGLYSLAAFDHNNMHSGLFDICLIILYVRSANWILVFLFLSVLFYYLWF